MLCQIGARHEVGPLLWVLKQCHAGNWKNAVEGRGQPLQRGAIETTAKRRTTPDGSVEASPVQMLPSPSGAIGDNTSAA